MEEFLISLRERINSEIQNVESSENNVTQKSLKIIQLLETAYEEMKKFITGYTFKDQSEEIYFFKEVKPKLFSLLVYHNKLYAIEMRMPAGSISDKRVYLENILERQKYFFDHNMEFYHYYRSGSTHLDKYYFLRGKHDIKLILDSFYFERDTHFSTSHDFKVAKILANEMLNAYVNNKLLLLEQQSMCVTDDNTTFLKAKHRWTGSKTDLVELIYGLYVSGSINNGQIELKELADYFGNMMNVDLKDLYRLYLNIRCRKDNRTAFLDSMVESLEHKMDEDDDRR